VALWVLCLMRVAGHGGRESRGGIDLENRVAASKLS
jgi:hypothetical protein